MNSTDKTELTSKSKQGVDETASRTKGPKNSKSKTTNKAQVADSWEDDLDSDDSEPKHDAKTSQEENHDAAPHDYSSDPPAFDLPHQFQKMDIAPSVPQVRPEKSTAAARRMIAGSLGIRVRRTEEQKRFEEAQAANVRKKRQEDRKQKEDEERLKKAIWED